MSLTINTNAVSLNAQRNTVNNMQSLQTTMARLSSGLRINTAKDDAAGLAIAERMNSQARGMTVALQNAADGLSMVEVADGAVASASDILQRMRDLAVRSLNGTNDATSRGNLNAEFKQLASELSRLSTQTSFNGRKIIGASAQGFKFQIGADAGQNVSVRTSNLSAVIGNAIIGTGTVSTSNGASTALGNIDTALQKIATTRANFGAAMSRFENIMSNLRTGIEKQSAARGRIMDADFAAETANLSRTQILQQAGTAMVAQANQLPQNVLALLR